MSKKKVTPDQISPGKGPGQHCHQMVRAIAIEMAGALYDDLMHNNAQYAEWKAMNPGLNATQLEIRFIEAKWGELIEDARATMAQMLATAMSDDLKRPIFDALVADNELRVHRMQRRRDIATGTIPTPTTH